MKYKPNSGAWRKTLEGYRAFYPAPLPPAKKASESLGVAYNTANRSLLALEKVGIYSR